MNEQDVYDDEVCKRLDQANQNLASINVIFVILAVEISLFFFLWVATWMTHK